MKLNWKNLKHGMCPKCGRPLTVLTMTVFCPIPCGFSMGREKMEQLKYNMVNNIYTGRRNFEEGYG